MTDGVLDPAIVSTTSWSANELLATGGSGAMNIIGHLGKPSILTVNEAAITMSPDNFTFSSQIMAGAGANSFSIVATEGQFVGNLTSEQNGPFAEAVKTGAFSPESQPAIMKTIRAALGKSG